MAETISCGFAGETGSVQWVGDVAGRDERRTVGDGGGSG